MQHRSKKPQKLSLKRRNWVKTKVEMQKHKLRSAKMYKRKNQLIAETQKHDFINFVP